MRMPEVLERSPFLPDYHDGAGSVGLFGVEGPDGISAGDRDG